MASNSDVGAPSHSETRQHLIATTFVEIVDTLVGDFDVIDVLTLLSSRCVELLAAGAAGILLADSKGRLSVVGSSTEQIHLLELFQIQNDEGPCLDCFRSGAVILHSDLDTVSPWPHFAAACTKAGFASVCAVPLRVKSHVLGCLNLFMSGSAGLGNNDVAVAQALADFASITIIQDQATREATIRQGELEHALNSRVAIEQAKGMIAERTRLTMDEAFARLRRYARSTNRGLTSVANAIIDGSLPIDVLASRRLVPPPTGRLAP